MLLAAFLVGACAGGVLVATIEASANSAERIYRARHRKHSMVPCIDDAVAVFKVQRERAALRREHNEQRERVLNASLIDG